MSSALASRASSAPRASAHPVSRGQAHYALGLLVAVYVFNFVDRNVFTILAKPIQEELEISDSLLGALLGPVFVHLLTRPIAERLVGFDLPLDEAISQLTDSILEGLRS